MLALSSRDEIEEDSHEIVEKDGYKFAANKDLADLFKNFVVDYKARGFNKGFKVRLY